MRQIGQDARTWTDHTDVRPTILSLVGLKDTYVHDGRVLVEALETHAQPLRLRGHASTLSELTHVYKQINAPFGRLALESLEISTAALSSGDANGDAVYSNLQAKIAGWTARRDVLADAIKTILGGAAFDDERLDEGQMRQLAADAVDLLQDVRHCAEDVARCALK